MNKIEKCYRDFGLLIQRKRIRLGMTQERFSKEFKINRIQLCKLENGKARITFHSAVSISNKLKLNLNGIIK